MPGTPALTRKPRPRLLSAVTVVVLTAVIAGCGADSGGGTGGGEELPEVTINVGHVGPSTDPIQQVLEAVAERVSERSGGRLTLALFPDGQLGQGQDMLEQTAAGAAQIAHLDPGYAAEVGGVDEMNILNGPFLFRDLEDVNAVLDSDLGQDLIGQLEDNGWHSLTWGWYLGERHIIGTRGFPSPDDLEGVKIRVPPSPAWVETFEALPTTPTPLEWSEIYTGLSQGVIDAAEGPLAGLKGSSLHEVADTITLTSHFKAITGWATSVTFWESLPAEYQDILSEEFQAGGERLTEISVQQEGELRREFQEELGVTLVEPDIDAYAEAARPFYDAFPTWRDGLHEQVQEILGDG